MKKEILLALALVSAMPLTAHAQVVSPAPATPGASANPAAVTPPVTLRLKFTPGQTLYYSLVADTDGAMQSPMVTTSVPIKNHVEMGIHQTVKSVRAADGAATLETGIDSLSFTMNGQTVPIPPDTLTQMKTVGVTVILPTGKVLSFTPSATLGGNVVPGMDLSHANALGSIGQLPDGPVKVGDTWKSAVSLGMAGAQGASNFTLASVDTTGGKTIALVEQTTTGDFDPSATKTAGALPLGMKIAGKVRGTGKLRFDVLAGTLESAATQSDMTMTIGTKADAPSTMIQMKITTTMKRMDSPAPATKVTP